MSKIIRVENGIDEARIEPFDSDAFAEEAVGRSGEALSPDVIVNRAMKEAEQIRAEAQKAGYEEGLNQARDEVHKEMYDSVRMLRTVLEQASVRIAEIVQLSEPQLLRLACKIASRVTGREARVNEDLVASSIRKAIGAIIDREGLVIRVNPLDLRAARAAKVDLGGTFDGIREVKIVADDSIQRGGAVVETEHVKSDAELETQIEQILAELDDVWNRS